MAKAKVLLFKESGKWYTEEEWEIPEDAIGPYDMAKSPDYRTIGNGPVLVVTQEPWGFPCLLNNTPHLTVMEHKAMDQTAELWNNLVQHVVANGPSREHDLAEIASHIHSIQSRIMGQAAARGYPNDYRLLGETLDPIGDPPR